MPAMSYPRTQAFIHNGYWDEETRAHPAMKWMEAYTLDMESHTFDPKWYTSDFSLHKADGRVFNGLEGALVGLRETYAPLPKHFHEPYYLSCIETQDGWEMLGQARAYAILPGKPAIDEVKVKDNIHGLEWDIALPAAFKFRYVKDTNGPDGILMSRTELMSDSGPALKRLLKRGVLKWQDLGF